MKIKRTISALLGIITAVSPLVSVGAEISVFQREKNGFEAVGTYLADTAGSIVVQKSGAEDLNNRNFSSSTAYINGFTANSYGAFSHKFSLPDGAEDGEYNLKINGVGGQDEGSFYFSNSGVMQFYEPFDNAIRWNCNNMGIVDGKMQTKVLALSSVSLKGGLDNFWRNFELSFKLAFAELGNRDPWVMLRVRTGSDETEGILMRPTRVARYKNGKEYQINGTKGWYMNAGEEYIVKVKCDGNNVNVTLYSEDETVIYDGSYDAGSTAYGGIAFSTSNCRVTIDDLRVINTQTDDTLLCEKNVCVNIGDEKSMAIYSACGGETWKSDNTEIARVDENGNVTGISEGETVISILDSDGAVLDKTPITVYSGISSLKMSQRNVTLYQGENIGVECTVTGDNASELTWTCNGNAELFGSAYTARTIVGKAEGTALVTVQTADGTISESVKVRILPKKSGHTTEAMFKLSGTGHKLNPYLFGIHHYYWIKGNYVDDMLSDVGFNITRTMKNSSTLDFSAATEVLDCPQLYVIPFADKTNEEILANIAEAKEAAKGQKLFVELGNEVYVHYKDDAEKYMQRCEEVYPLVKEAYPDIKFGVVLKPYKSDRGWNSVVAKYDCYDAVIPHNYTSVSHVRGSSTSEMMKMLYLDNVIIREGFEVFRDMFPGKQIWVTEYGNLVLDVFNDSDMSEGTRKSYAKTTGVAICNMEKIMDMAAENVDISCYHMSNDAQGFGIIQGDCKLQNYYVFKKAGELINGNEYFYDISPVLCERHWANHRISGGKYIVGDTVGAWGFGDENGAKYAVISNRNPDSTKVALSGKKLKLLWSYGGDTDDVLGNFLTETGRLDKIPDNIELPKEYNGDFADYVDITGYTIAVCEIENADAVTATIGVSSDKWDFDKCGDAVIAASEECSANDIKLYKNGSEISATVTILENLMQVRPEEGWAYGAKYQIVCDAKIGGRTFNFETIDRPKENNYTEKCFYDTLKIGSWNQVDTGVKCRDFVMTFDVDWSDKSNYLMVAFRGGSIRIHKNMNRRFSYFNGENDVQIGIFDGFEGMSESVRIEVSGNMARLYEKSPSDRLYKFIGQINYIEDVEHAVSFNGPANCTLKNVKITVPSAIGNVRCYQQIGNEKIYSDKPLIGKNFFEIFVDEGGVGKNYSLTAEVFNKGKSEIIVTPEKISDGLYGFSYDCTGDNRMIKIFLWNSLNEMTPLDGVYTIE